MTTTIPKDVLAVQAGQAPYTMTTLARVMFTGLFAIAETHGERPSVHAAIGALRALTDIASRPTQGLFCSPASHTVDMPDATMAELWPLVVRAARAQIEFGPYQQSQLVAIHAIDMVGIAALADIGGVTR